VSKIASQVNSLKSNVPALLTQDSDCQRQQLMVPFK